MVEPRKQELLCRLRDRSRGVFEPRDLAPAATKANPKAHMRPGKSAEDRLPADERPRVQAWRRRLERSRNR
jgi:hypothetical protein